jgi:hypothetical protein
MSSYMMGYHYEMPKRGDGVRLTCGRLLISSMTKASANNVKKQLILDGHSKDDILIEKNEY